MRIIEKGLILLALFSFVLLLTGCNTAKGFGQDCKETWKNMKQADDWLQEHAW